MKPCSSKPMEYTLVYEPTSEYTSRNIANGDVQFRFPISKHMQNKTFIVKWLVASIQVSDPTTRSFTLKPLICFSSGLKNVEN